MTSLEHIVLTIGIAAAAVSVMTTLYSLLRTGMKRSANIILKTNGKTESFEITPEQAARFKALLDRRRAHRMASQQHAPPPPKHAATR
jgi:hypothetical protein